VGIAVGGDTDPRLLSSHIDAGGMLMDAGHVLGCGGMLLRFFGHTCLQGGQEKARKSGRE
jgi:hypothetical protein